MKFSEIVKQASALLKDKGQTSYRMLKREFDLNDETLEDLKAELIEVDRLAIDQDGKMLGLERARDKGGKDQGINGNPEGEKCEKGKRQRRSSQSSASNYLHTSTLGRAHPRRASTLEARGNTDGERKTITALFADLKGSTALIEGLDPEEARAIIDPALQLMMDAVHRYEGYVAQALGDGIFALFGAPHCP